MAWRIRSIHGGHIRNVHRRMGGHIHSIHRKHQHQPWPLAQLQHQQISCRSSIHGGHMGIRSIRGGHNHRRMGGQHIHSIHTEHRHQP